VRGRLSAGAGAVAALVAALLPMAATASASVVEQITFYDIRLTVSATGNLHVQETLDYDFGFQQRHGIIRVIPEKVRADDTYDRVFPIDNIEVTATGASGETSVSRSDGDVSIRIGDPDETVSGAHTYVIDYDVGGAVESFAKPFDHVELNWNAIGNEWNVPVERARVRVIAPVMITAATCFSGVSGSTLPCERKSTRGSTATFSHSGLAPGQGLTVVTAFPIDSVAANGPILRERPSLRRAFALTPASLSLTGAVLLVIIAGIARVYWARGRDRRYVGQVPGLEPASGQPVSEETLPLLHGVPTVVEFAPPDGIRPGQCGTLLDERADILDVTATTVDLAVRGYLRIDEKPREHWWNHKDWTLTRLKEPAEGLVDYEARLMKGLFRSGTVVELSDLRNTFYKDLAAVQNKLYEGVVAARWFRRRPDRVREVWTLIGGLCSSMLQNR
jgi:hypothetical protein